MTPVFLDTVGLLAIWDRRDQWHRLATEAFTQISDDNWFPVTSPYVLLECANAAARRPYRGAVARMREALMSSNGILEPTSKDIVEAWKRYLGGDPSAPGVVDLGSFELMRRSGVIHAFTNDRHFRDAGFITLF